MGPGGGLPLSAQGLPQPWTRTGGWCLVHCVEIVLYVCVGGGTTYAYIACAYTHGARPLLHAQHTLKHLCAWHVRCLLACGLYSLLCSPSALLVHASHVCEP